MAVTFNSFIERFEDQSPSTAGCSMQGGRAVMDLWLEGNPSTTDLQNALTTILGTTATKVSDGRLQRTLPMAHPVYPYLYASSIPTIQGIGQPTKETAAGQLEAPTLPFFLLYPTYKYTVEFTPRQYAVLQDSSIPLLKSQTFIDEANVTQTTNIAAEWLRFADWYTEPHIDTVTAQFGQMKFRTQSGSAPGNGVQFTGQIKVTMPDQVLKIILRGIPYRWVTSANSFIRYFPGRVNQKAFTVWQPGQLLYVNYSPKPYTPPVQKIDQNFFGASGYIYSTERLCDVELTFLLTTRVATDVPNSVSNGNWIAAGWNCNVWYQTRKFYYATAAAPPGGTDSNQALWQPLFNSFDARLLFTDPDATGVYQVPSL